MGVQATRNLSKKLVRFIKRNVMPQQSHYWEYYGRVRFASDLILNSDLPDYKVLDLGGATGNNLLKKFGVKNVMTLDLKEGADIVASASDVPVEDGAFEFVTSLDMLEHVPQGLRLKVVEELVRICKKKIILIAPVKSDENIWAEQFVLQHRPDDFLKEHLEQGLVDFDQIEKQVKAFQSDGRVKSYRRYELDNLQTWVSLMTEDFCNSSEVYQACYEKLENRFVPRRLALIIEK